jgi:16S rRNA processing protein RimM
VIGLEAWTTEDEHLGQVTDILYTGANDVYVIQTPDRKEILIPAVEDVVLDIDPGAGRVLIAPLGTWS